MHLSYIKEVHEGNLSDSNDVILDHLPDTLLTLSQEAVRLAVQLKENSNRVELLIKHVNDLRKIEKPSSKSMTKKTSSESINARSKATDNHYTISPSMFWAFE